MSFDSCVHSPSPAFAELLRDPQQRRQGSKTTSSFLIPTGIMMKEEALNEYMSRNQNNFFSRQEEANLSPVQWLPHAARGLSSEARTECPCRLAGSWKRPLPSSYLVPGLAGRSPCVPTGGPCCLCIVIFLFSFSFLALRPSFSRKRKKKGPSGWSG